MNAYSFFAKHYDELTHNAEYGRRAEYFSALLLSCGLESGCVLDLACGTGSLTVELAKRGYDMIGVDMSVDMLSLAQNKAFEAGTDILFICQRMQGLELCSAVDAAVCTLDSINHLTHERELRQTFERLSRVIRPGGAFIFDVNTVYKHRNVLGDNTFIYETPDVFCVWQNSFDAVDDSVEITLDFFERRGAVYERCTESFRERAYETELLSDLLEKAGFETENVFEEFTRQPVGGSTQRAVVVARRR